MIDFIAICTAALLAIPASVHIYHLLFRDGWHEIVIDEDSVWSRSWIKRLSLWAFGTTLGNTWGFWFEYVQDAPGKGSKLGGLSEWNWTWRPAHGESNRFIQQRVTGEVRTVGSYAYREGKILDGREIARLGPTEGVPGSQMLAVKEEDIFFCFIESRPEGSYLYAGVPEKNQFAGAFIPGRVRRLFRTIHFMHCDSHGYKSAPQKIRCRVKIASRREIMGILPDDFERFDTYLIDDNTTQKEVVS